jgi:hypothetical protein
MGTQNVIYAVHVKKLIHRFLAVRETSTTKINNESRAA